MGAADPPVALEERRDAQAELRVAGSVSPIEGGANVVALEVEPPRPRRRPRAPPSWGSLSASEPSTSAPVPRAARPPPADSASRSRANSRIVSSIQKRSCVRRTRLFSTSDCSTARSAPQHLLRRLERAAAAEDREAGEEPLLGRRRGGRRTTRSSRAACAGARRRRGRPRAGRGAARAARGSGPARAPPSAPPRARPPGEVVERGAQSSSTDRRRLEPGARAQNSSTASGVGKRRHGVGRPRRGRAGSSRLVTRSAQVRACLEQVGEPGAASTTCSKLSSSSSSSRSPTMRGELLLRAERLGDRRRGTRAGSRSVRQPDPEDAARGARHQLGRGLDREARLARAAGPAQRDEREPPGGATRSPRPPAPGRRTTRPAAGRFVFEIVLSGGKRSSPSW